MLAGAGAGILFAAIIAATALIGAGLVSYLLR